MKYFSMVLFIMLFKVVLTFEFGDESVTIQMKATKQYFLAVLFIKLYKVILTFESMNESLKCESN